MPPWGIVNYQPMDEGQYATMALNDYNYGSLRLDINLKERDFMTSAHIRNNIVGNLLIYAGMVLFGDNYYGFRFSSIFVGFFNFLLFGAILSNLKSVLGKEKYKARNTYLFCGIMFLFVTDFVYHIACRTVETTIYRMFFLQLILWFLTLPVKNEVYKTCLRFMIVGFLAVFSVFAVYITNIFIVAAILGIVVFYGICHGIKYFIEAFSGLVAGSGMAYVICDLYYNIVWGSSNIVNTMQIISDFTGVSGYASEKNMTSFFISFINFLSANSNLYNIGIWFVFLLSIPLISEMILKEKNESVFILFIIYSMFLMQTFINDDYVVRKYVLVFPIVFYLLYAVTISNSLNKIEKYFKEKRSWIIGYSIICLGMCMGIVIYRLFLIGNGTCEDFSTIDKMVVLSQIFFVIFIECLVLRIVLREKLNRFILEKLFIGAILLGCLIPNIYLNLKYVYLNNSYTEKELMQAVGEYANEEWVYGIYSISFTLYNDIKPIVNSYDDMRMQITEYEDKWYLDYSEFMFPSKVMKSEILQWNEYVTFEREFSTFGQKRSVSLYYISRLSEK